MTDPTVCSSCATGSAGVIETRYRGGMRRRRRRCVSCGHRWNSVEVTLEDYTALTDEHERLLQRERERAARAERALTWERKARMTDIRTALQEIARVARDKRATLVIHRLQARGEMLRDLVSS